MPGGNAIESLWPFANPGWRQDWHLAIKDSDRPPFTARELIISGKDLMDPQERLAKKLLDRWNLQRDTGTDNRVVIDPFVACDECPRGGARDRMPESAV